MKAGDFLKELQAAWRQREFSEIAQMDAADHGACNRGKHDRAEGMQGVVTQKRLQARTRRLRWGH